MELFTLSNSMHMSSITFILIVLLIITVPTRCQRTWGPHRMVTLNSATTFINGVSVLENTNSIRSNSMGQWILSPSNFIGYDLKISLDSTWAWMSTKDSRINLNIYTADNQSLNTADDLIIVFSSAEIVYISTIISLNNANDNYLYPSCAPNNSVTGFASGNIESILLQSTGNESRISRVTNGTVLIDGDKHSMKNAVGQRNDWPLEFQFINEVEDGDWKKVHVAVF